MMDNYCAPQWTDFTSSPQLPSDSYFEIEHETHKPLVHFKSNIKTDLPILWKEECVNKQSISETNFDDSLDTVQNTNDNTAYFIPLGNTKHSVDQIKNENRLSNAMESLKLDEKSRKIDCAWNVWLTGGTNSLKAPILPRRLKTALSEKNWQNIRTSEINNTVPSSLQNKQIINNVKKSNREQIASAKTKTEPLSKSDSNSSASCRVSCTDERASYKIISARREHCKPFKGKQSQPKVLTCQYRRASLIKALKSSNKFISMAEAVSKFQNKTPQRFRTISNKDLKPGSFMKLKQSPLKLTNPISPALRSKKRARHTTVLSKEEREAVQLEEMKKHQIKAKPVPLNILKGPAPLKKVTKKPITVTEEFRLTQPKKLISHKSDSQVNIQSQFDNKEQSHLNTASIVRSVSASNVATKKEPNPRKEHSINTNAKPATSVLPSSFAVRNKEFQMRKEEKLKSLQIQETNKMKVEFHARPVPKFLKPPLSIKDQNLKRRTVASCPFSFAERDKNLAKKKEEHVKQIHENNKKTRAFHANPVPRYKPRGLSKENVRGKEKDANSTS
ncbi:uncharacterized protein LOC128879120 isoform X1 [Hylaeus volcanicus]|uniref:uncharacterized protein LOC128879120 isoform X1 n=1 Tax=Hylaeus volcanicus TaxID=313075 RepID=UPI0023B86A3B|nr:uncharacterized protein LOC128879120 isoform X1 [Hylaeus volcanicus]XP_053983975.1 uncharacterized protein LOC128879120 isoform X1 [Hylaeus volcanicus]